MLDTGKQTSITLVRGGDKLDYRITPPEQVIKRDGRVVAFDEARIELAITKCFSGLDSAPLSDVHSLVRQVTNIIAAKYTQPSVEQIQDVVETVLQSAGEYEAAKHYILYRAEKAKTREKRPIPDSVRSAFVESSKYFPTELQQLQFYDKYSRFDYNLGRRETWIETVDRSVGFLASLSNNSLGSETYERIRRFILEMRSIPSMRLLAMAGPAAERSNITVYNCSYMPVESIDSFVEALIISMSGCGVGYSVEKKYVENFPRIKRQTGKTTFPYVVEDSAEGWAKAVRLGAEAWFEGAEFSYDLSLLRPMGAPLKTKGGRASGPEPLRQMLEFMRSRILARQGTFLRPIDAHDIMCAVGNAAVSGGVRRTAMISLFDYDDDEMRLSKNGDFERDNSQRWNANNSAVWNDNRMGQPQFVSQFMEMVRSEKGEPGIFSRFAGSNMRPSRRQDADFGTNPCVTKDTWIFTSEGPRQVRDLLGRQHSTYINGSLYKTNEDGFWSTGVKDVYKLTTKEGYTLKLTENHKLKTLTKAGRAYKEEWKPISDIKPGDRLQINRHKDVDWDGEGTEEEGWLLGYFVGNGTFASETVARVIFAGEAGILMGKEALELGRKIGVVNSGLYETRTTLNTEILESDVLPGTGFGFQSAGIASLAKRFGIVKGKKTITKQIEKASSLFYTGFLRGLFDADGSVMGNSQGGLSVRLNQSNKKLLRATQRMLLRLGIASKLYLYRQVAGYKKMPDGKGGLKDYWCKANHELAITKANLEVFSDRVGLSKKDKKKALEDGLGSYGRRGLYKENFDVTVATIEQIGKEEVFDCSVPGANAFDANGFVSHNCGEILLRPWQFCNLTAAVARAEDTYETLKEKVEVASIIGTIQSMATNFPGLRPMWKKNCEEERLLGVDITGQMDSLVAQDKDVKASLRDYAVAVNVEYAQKLGINASASVTCVKPSGNSSQLLNCSSGLHARWSPYYIRNVRISAHSPIFKVMRDAGAPMDPENGQQAESATAWVVHFPVKSPDGAVTRNERTAVEQCEFWLQNKLYWTEHNPSCTITYKEDEVIDLMKWVWDHREVLGGLSFLPAFDAQYDQMPYMEITEAEYNKLASEFPKIDFSKLYYYEEEDLTTAAQELACVSGACEVDFSPKK